MKVFFTEFAQKEFDDASCFYELEFSGLGRRFQEEIRQAVNRIREYPKALPTERGDIRKCLLHKFPYKILYSIEKDHILVIAIAHQHRKPAYWADKD